MKSVGKSGHQSQATGSMENSSFWRVVSLAEVARESRSRNGGQLDDKLLCGVLKSHGLVPMRERVKGDSTDRCKVVAPNAFAYNPMRLNIGSIARNTADHSVMVSPDYVVFQTDPDRLLPNYLDHVRHSGFWQSYVGATGDGSVRVRIYYDQLSRLQLPLPPIPEQQKIAAILTAVDEKLDVISRQIEAIQTLKRGLMQTLFNRGVGTQDSNGCWMPCTEFKDSVLGEIPADWQVVQIQAVSEVIRGASPRPQGDPRYYGGDVPRLMGADVTRDGKWVIPKIDFLTEEGAKRSRPCPKGTLTIICSGDVGVPSFLAVDACIHDGFLALINIDESKANKNYLYHIIYSVKQRFYTSATHGGVFINLTTGILKEFLVPLPTVVEQQKIASILDVADEKITTALRKREYYQGLKRGLMQKLLTGEWCVKVDSPTSAV